MDAKTGCEQAIPIVLYTVDQACVLPVLDHLSGVLNQQLSDSLEAALQLP